MTGQIEEVRLIDLPSGASRQAVADMHNWLGVFRIAPGEAAERPELRGTTARAGLYLSQTYKLDLTAQDRQRYEGWNLQHPPEPWERKLNQAVACVQGDGGNSFVGPIWPCGTGMPAK